MNVQYIAEVWNLKDLVIGYKAPWIIFRMQPYQERELSNKADFDRLAVSIEKAGIHKPLITYKHCILVGMRRFDIGKRMGIESVMVWRITENIDLWTRDDLSRLEAMKAAIGEAEY